MALNAATVWRDYETDGIPSSGPHKVKKSEVRAIHAGIDSIINAFLSNGGLIFASKASLDASLNYAANTMAWVMGDPVAANNGVYRKTGAPGTGSWIRIGDLPYSFIIASDAGAGTANAIQATTSLPVSGSALIWMNIFEANTASPVTVSFNGGATLTVKTNSGNDVTIGGLTAGMIVMGVISGSTFRLISDQASSAILAQAEAAAATATAAAASLASRVGYSVDILDYTTSNAQRTALLSGSVSIKPFWDLAAADAVARGIKVVSMPAGNFRLNDGETLDNPGVYVRGESGGTILRRYGAGRMFRTLGSAPNASSGGYALTANAAVGVTSATLSTADAANFAAEQIAIIRSGKISTGSLARDAEFVRIRSVNTGTGVVTFYGSLSFSYATADTAKLYPVNLIEGVGYENLIIDWTNGTKTTPQRPPYNIDEAFAVSFCQAPRFINITMRRMISHGVSLHGCMNAYVENVRGYDGYCDGFDMVDAYSYVIAEVGLNVGTIVEACYAERCRHLFTTLTVDSTNADYFNGGHPMFTEVNNCIAREMKAAAFDTHGAGYRVSFNNCRVLCARGAGFQLRSYAAMAKNCYACDILPLDGTTDQGHGVWLVGTLANDLFARDCRVEDFEAENCYGAGLYDQSLDAVYRNVTVRKTNLPGIVASGTGAGDLHAENIRLEDVAKSPGGLGAYSVVIGNSVQRNPVIDGLKVRDPNNNLSALVRRENTAANRIELTNVRGRNSAGDPIVVASSVTNTDGMIIRGGYGPQSIGPISAVVIASDSISAAKLYAGGVLLSPESGTTDTLSTIIGGERDAELIIFGSAGNVITVAHGTGTDQIVLQGAANVNLASNLQCIRLIRRGSTWVEEVERNF